MTEIILGIDPGTRRCGFGLVAKTGDQLTHVDHGIIHMRESWSLAERLRCLEAEMRKLYAQFPIKHTAVEKIFFGKNADSAFKLGHARGVCLLLAAQHDAAVAEYAATFVKKCVTGNGAASKEHVQLVVFNLLRVTSRGLAHDASDALSLAVTHARVSDAQATVERATKLRAAGEAR